LFYFDKHLISCAAEAKLDAHAVEHEPGTEIIAQEEEIPQEAIPVTKEEETIIAEVVNAFKLSTCTCKLFFT
jgi:hypothetical protein